MTPSEMPSWIPGQNTQALPNQKFYPGHASADLDDDMYQHFEPTYPDQSVNAQPNWDQLISEEPQQYRSENQQAFANTCIAPIAFNTVSTVPQYQKSARYDEGTPNVMNQQSFYGGQSHRETGTPFQFSTPYQWTPIDHLQDLYHGQHLSGPYYTTQDPRHQRIRPYIDAMSPAMISPIPIYPAQNTLPRYPLQPQASTYDVHQSDRELGLSQQPNLLIDAGLQSSVIHISDAERDYHMFDQGADDRIMLEDAQNKPVNLGSDLSPSNPITAVERQYFMPIGHETLAVHPDALESQAIQASPMQEVPPERQISAAKVQSSMNTDSALGSKRLRAQLRLNRQFVERAGVRKSVSQAEKTHQYSKIDQSTSIRRIYELQTEGAVADTIPVAQEGETEVNIRHYTYCLLMKCYTLTMEYTAFSAPNPCSCFFLTSSR